MKGKLDRLLVVVLLVSLCTACGATPASQVVEVEKEVTRIVEGTPVVQIVKETVVVEQEVMVTSAPEPEAKGGTLLIAQRQEPDSLDVHRSGFAASLNVIMNIYDCLFFMNPETNELEPWLAESWDVSDDGTTWTFHLRQGVTFHDGTPFNADAVKFNLDRVVAPETASPVGASLLGPYEGSDVLDEYTVAVNFSEPFAPLADGLSQAFLGIASPTAIEKWGEDFGQHPVGSGPFMFKEWASKDHITLVANPDYNWAPAYFNRQGPPYLDEVITKFIEEPSTRMAVLETGEANVIELVPSEEVASLAADSHYNVIQASCPGNPETVWINVQKPPTDDVRVRQAIFYAIDRQVASDTIEFGVCPVAYGPISATTLCFDQELKENYPYPYDLDKANALLEEAGWVEGPDGIRVKDGQRLEMTMNKHKPSGVWVELIQGMLREVGIDMIILDQETGAFMETGQTGAANLAPMGWISKDPVVMESIFHSKNIGNWNWVRTQDETLDELIERSLTTIDMEERCPIVVEAQRWLMNNAVMAPIYDIVQVVAMRSEVHDLELDARSYYRLLYNTWVSK